MKPLRRCIISLAVLLVIFGTARVTSAATASSAMNVSATVVQGCLITSVSDIGYGDYNPSSGTPKDGEGNFTFTCLTGTSYELYITGARAMSDGSGNSLNYELYTDAGRSTAWPSTTPSSENGVAPDGNPITKSVFGRIPAGQHVPAGPYSNIVMIVIGF